MQADIRDNIVKQLQHDYGLKPSTDGEWLQQGRCPTCNKKELFTHAREPWLLKCGRENKCGDTWHTKELYPEAFKQFNQRYQPTPQNPNATADAYLSMARGFDLNKIKGWYRQEKFWHPNGNKGTATVRFDIDRAQDIYMERLIEEIIVTDNEGRQEKRKAHFGGAHRGLWWQPPGLTFKSGDTVWIVEGCMDAIALNLNGQKAVANLACRNYPEKSINNLQNKKRITFVWALDPDEAGRRYAKKHYQRAGAEGLQTDVATIPTKKLGKKIDWNDLHIREKLTHADREEYLYYGKLLVAENALAKALLMWQKKSLNGFCFDFNYRLYWFDLDMDKYTKSIDEFERNDDGETEAQIKSKAAEQSGALTEIANCRPTFLYFQANKITDESWYYCKVEFPHSGKTIKNTFTGGQMAAAAEFKKRLLSIAPGGLFTGTSSQLNWLVRNHIQNIKVVDTIDFIGYSKEHKAYVYNDIAISRGKAYPINDEDFFEVENIAVKSLNQSVNLSIGKPAQYRKDWAQLVYHAFGEKGLVAVTFWLGSLFAEQIRGIHKSYPFLEIMGEAGAGKTTLVEFMWKLLGKADEEGFDPSKATSAAISRKFSQVSNLPVVLIEADREEDTAKSKKFDWDELKTAYNGRASRARGMKNSGNETYEPPFRGAIVISQNAAVTASEAILQRIIHLHFDKSHHCEASKQATDEMNILPVEELSYFLHLATKNEKRVMDLVKSQTPIYERQLLQLPEIKSVRIALNHAQLMALSDALCDLANLTQEQKQKIHDCITQLAISRQRAIVADHHIVQQFWEIYEYLNNDGAEPVLNHSANKELIAVNLNHFVKVATDNRQQIPLLSDLKKHLKSSRSRKFHDIKAVSSAIEKSPGTYSKSKTVKCWIFEAVERQ